MLTSLNPEDLLLGAPKLGDSSVALSIPEDTSLPLLPEDETVVAAVIPIAEEEEILEQGGHEGGAMRRYPATFAPVWPPFMDRYYTQGSSQNA